jgi:hypothetical protein
MTRIGSRIRTLTAPVRSRVDAAQAVSIWAPDAVGVADLRLSRMLRRSLPEFYIACALFGILGSIGGVPALRDTFGEGSATVLGAILCIVSLAAGAGEAFPERLWRVEFYAAYTLAGLILLYSAAVVLAGLLAGDAGRAAVGAAIYAMAVLPRWRARDVRTDRERNGWP